MRIAEAFQIFKVSQSGVRMGVQDVQWTSALHGPERSVESGAPCALTQDAGKLRKSKNEATSAGNACMAQKRSNQLLKNSLIWP